MKTSKSMLDLMVEELLISEVEEDDLTKRLEIITSKSRRKAISLRLEIVAIAFARGLNLEQLNETLVLNGCEQLYARSIYEATLIYAFNNGLKYYEWKPLLHELDRIRARISPPPCLSGKSITLNNIKEYVSNNSEMSEGNYATKHETRRLFDQISDMSLDNKAFIDYIRPNIFLFSFCRERTRYYFCKYLMYYLESLIERKDISLRDLSLFKSQTILKRKKHTKEETKETLLNSPISFGEIYDAFQKFYFEYTDVDWMTVMLEHYDSQGELSEEQKRSLADSIRRYNRILDKMSDNEVIEWKYDELEKEELAKDEEYSLKAKKTSYGAGRSGENFIRKVIRGEVDLDRTTLLAFLLFFDKSSNVPTEQRLDVERLSEVLSNSHFPDIDQDNPIDAFFVDFIHADDPMLFLIQEAEMMAMSEENFYLYKTYLSSKSNDVEFRKAVE